MRHIIIISFMILVLSGITCTRDGFNFNVDCDECYFNKPDSADLVVNITINAENPYVPLVFYRGKVEDGIIEWVDTSTTTQLMLFSPVDEYYSVKAIYKNGDKTIVAIDGAKLNTRQVSGVCDRDCWAISGGLLDVRLK